MGTSSVKRPILVYGLFFSFALAFAAATIASSALVRTTRAAQLEAASWIVRLYADQPSIADAEHAVARASLHQGFALEVVTATSAGSIAIDDARRAVSDPQSSPRLAAAPVRAPGIEAYVALQIPPSPALTVAREEIRRMILYTMLSALAAGVLLSLMISRLVLPPLEALRRFAEESRETVGAMPSEDAPNEIADVAQAFRRTMRQLAEDRDRIEAQHRELEKMQHSLIRASKLAGLGRLAAGVAHEIGNPLAAVVGYLSLLGRGLTPEEQQDILQRCTAQLNRIHDTIKKLLAYARHDESTEDIQPLSTAAVIRDALLLVRGHPALRGVEIESDAGEGGAIDANGRPGALGQVLVNVLLNAAQAMDGLDERKIRISVSRAAEKVEIAIDDRGPGIPPDKLEQIFDPFYTTKPPGEGTGLGLAVSRGLMEAMGGAIDAGSREGGGARFTISLDAAPIG